ncbi:MAG: GTP pyrophosphokinase family protein [Ruminococcus sp.]|nr:GTP pyrophosphokinase family protein [Ruminococcus sp.]
MDKLETLQNLPREILNQDALLKNANMLLDTMLDFRELMLCYSCAIKEIRTKLEILDKEFEVQTSRNPIAGIQTRLKSQTSVMEKMARKGLEFTRENIENNLNDIAGLRVICSYVDDIYKIADALTAQDDIVLIEKKDYIQNPKENGYRSLHLIVTVPVFFAEHTKIVRAEVQIRTIAMDFWASLEHEIKYKKSIENPEQISQKLKKCSEMIAYTDAMMQSIRMQADSSQGEESEEDKIFQKLKRVDKSLE